MQAIFLLFRNVFHINQYGFGLVLLSNSLSDRCEEYFCLDSPSKVFKCAGKDSNLLKRSVLFLSRKCVL